MQVVGAGPDDFAADAFVVPATLAGLKSLLHATVLAGVKCQHGHPASRLQTRREVAQKHVERAELVIHRDAQRLEDPADSGGRFIARARPMRPRRCRPHNLRQRRRRRDRPAGLR